MSDGNFNRSLLPTNHFQSGLQAGRSQGRMHAINAFKEFLMKFHPDLDNDQFLHQLEEFRQLLSKRIK